MRGKWPAIALRTVEWLSSGCGGRVRPSNLQDDFNVCMTRPSESNFKMLRFMSKFHFYIYKYILVR